MNNEYKTELVQELATDIKSNRGISFRDLVSEVTTSLKSEPGYENWNRVHVARAIQLINH